MSRLLQDGWTLEDMGRGGAENCLCFFLAVSDVACFILIMDPVATLQHNFYKMLMESQYWPEQDLLDFQQGQLSQLLVHARENVPFYRDRLNCIFNADGSIAWDNWHEIPILKRHDLVENFDAMQSTVMPSGHGEVAQFSTSGSSGIQVTVSINGLASLASKATILRGHNWHGVDWQKNTCSWMGDEPGDNLHEGKKIDPWGPLWAETAQPGSSFEISRLASEDQVFDFIRRENIFFLSGRPKSMQQLALRAIQMDQYLPLDGIFTFGAGVEDDERDDCRKAFGCEIIELYSAKESSAIAYQCPQNNHLHINSEIMKFEILNDQDMPCAIGEMGRVVVTPIFFTAQPLIRYELGDLAIAGQKCSCGRTLPVLAKVSGRTTHLFRFPDGHAVAPSISGLIYRPLLGAKTWQFAQIAPMHVEVRYVPNDWDIMGQEEEMADVVRNHIRKDLTVTFKRLRNIPGDHNDKYIRYVCELPDSN